MNDSKQVVKLQLDYLQGPIWISDIETGEPFTGIEIIDTDTQIWELNKKIGQRFSSYYEFDSHDQPCWFNESQRNADRAYAQMIKCLENNTECELCKN